MEVTEAVMGKFTLNSEELNSLLMYDQESGKLYWKKRYLHWFSDSSNRTALHKCNNWNSLYAGKEALYHMDHKGYAYGSILSVKHFAHRVIWCMVHGFWPENIIDHIDGNTRNNKITNLRAATLSQNSHNCKIPAHNTSGKKGVGFHKATGKWRARIKLHNEEIYLGLFNCVTSAHIAYCLASNKYHGEFGRTE